MPGLSLALERERHREQGSHQVWDYILLWMGYTGSCFFPPRLRFSPRRPTTCSGGKLLVPGESLLLQFAPHALPTKHSPS
jgi:hypothetical protein